MRPAPDHHFVMSRLKAIDSAYRETPLTEASDLAATLGVSQLYLKDEGQRPLGSFKALGGTFAGLEAIAARGTAAGKLVCASDGNHGLAVATAARHARLPAQIFLPSDIAEERVRRILARGAEVVIVPGTFDDAVAAATQAAQADGAILIADTSDDVDDVVTGDVMAGYGVIAGELRDQFAARGMTRPTHLFIQAGVGGLAAAMARGLQGWMAEPAEIVVVEPEAAACVQLALRLGHPETVPGDLRTCASMLSCGKASAPALQILQHCGAKGITVSEEQLTAAPALLADAGAPATTPSGGAGFAGLVHPLQDPALGTALRLTPDSRVLIVISEGPATT